MNQRKLDGRRGENLAAEYLKKKKYRIVGLNFASRYGEIDVIAENREYVVFAEVKMRRSAQFAEAREFVTAAKQRRIISTAQLWLERNPTEKQPRFDVIEIYGSGTDVERIQHIENAF